MLIRLFEYDSQIALDDGEIKGNELTVNFPHSGVLFLRSNKNTPNEMLVNIVTPGGNVRYKIPVMKIQNYTLDDVFRKKLYFLLPFYIFTHEARFAEYE